jgi:hypothetical protein
MAMVMLPGIQTLRSLMSQQVLVLTNQLLTQMMLTLKQIQVREQVLLLVAKCNTLLEYIQSIHLASQESQQ